MLDVTGTPRHREPQQSDEITRSACVIVPAFDAAATLAGVLSDLSRALPDVPILVVDDGSTDETAEIARAAGVALLRHERNRGKGAALLTGLSGARARGYRVALTVDADAQHPADEARRVLLSDDDPDALVLGVRDLAAAGAPRANRISNGISNFFLSRFARQPLRDTQCGLRRYPVAAVLVLGPRADGYAFEAEALLLAARRGLRVSEVPVRVWYPPEGQRVTHFDSVRDPVRIIVTVLLTLARLRRLGR